MSRRSYLARTLSVGFLTLLLGLLGWVSNARSYSICIDPGHGGPGAGKWTGNNGDGKGAIGPNNLTEQWINLQIANELKSLLTSQGQTVYMTRTSETEYKSLSQRVEIANNSGARLFISIHHNGFPSGGQGTETLYSSENPKGNIFAVLVQPRLVAAFGYNDRGVKDEALYVLKKTKMAAALSEASNISYNETEETLMANNAGHRNAEAEALRQAYWDYHNKYSATTTWGGIKALYAAESGNASAKLSWQPAPGANGGTRYKVCYGTSSGSHPYSTGEINGCSKTISGLTPGTKYYFVIKVGSDADGWSEDSNEKWVIPYVEMHVPADYSTIQAAVDAAPSNGAAIIYVPSGYYHTGTTITINKCVSIHGAGYSNTIIDDPVEFYSTPMPMLTESGQVVFPGMRYVSIWGQGDCAFAWFSDYASFFNVKFWSWNYQQSYVVGLDVWDSHTLIYKSLFWGNGVLFWDAPLSVRYSTFEQAPSYALQLWCSSHVAGLWHNNIFTSNAGYVYGTSSVPHIDALWTIDNYWGTTSMSYIQSKMDVYNGIDIGTIRSSPVPDAYPKPIPRGPERLDIAALRQERKRLKARVETKSDSAALLLPKVVRIYQLLGEYDLAHRYLRNVEMRHADNKPLVLRARVLEVGNEIRRRRPFEALKKADALIKEHPETSVARQMLLTKGVIYMSDPEAGNVEKAMETFEQALATCSDKLLAKNIRRYLAMVADSKNVPVEKRPGDIELSCFPNPANPSTIIRFRLGQADQTILSIYNTLGQKINVLVDGEMTAGLHSVIWDGRDATGREAASGVYFIHLEAGGKVQAKKILLLR